MSGWRPDGLWFSDQHGGQIFRIGPGRDCASREWASGDCATAQKRWPTYPADPRDWGGCPTGRCSAVSMHEKKLFQVAFGVPVRFAGDRCNAVITLVADLGPYNAGLSNDMVVDAAGRCYIGNIGFDVYGGEALRPTVLLLVEPLAGGGAEPSSVAPSRSLVSPAWWPRIWWYPMDR